MPKKVSVVPKDNLSDVPPPQKKARVSKARSKATKKTDASGISENWIESLRLDSSSTSDFTEKKEPVILHLKCFLKDLIQQNNDFQKMLPSDRYNYDPAVPADVIAFNISEDQYSFIDEKRVTAENPPAIELKVSLPDKPARESEPEKNEEISLSTQHLNKKLRTLKIALSKNTLIDKSCACFWCTYEYDGPKFILPKYEMDDSIHGYGSFCSPECAAAFLMKQDLDDSVKFERYQLLNNLYNKLYDIPNSISLAPDPLYTLDKFFGTLTIEEFRALSKLNKRLVLIDRPMTRFLPELHEEMDEYSNTTSLYNSSEPNKSSFQVGTYRVRRQDEVSTKVCRKTIMREQFGCG